MKFTRPVVRVAFLSTNLDEEEYRQTADGYYEREFGDWVWCGAPRGAGSLVTSPTPRVPLRDRPAVCNATATEVLQRCAAGFGSGIAPRYNPFPFTPPRTRRPA